MKKIFLFAGVFALMNIPALYAQVTFGANVKPDSAAVLDLQSNGNKGLLLPRVVLTDTLIETSLAKYEQGMIVYNTTPSGDGKTKEGIYYNDGRRWRQVNTGVATIYSQPYWSLNGNARTSNANFLGTTDNSPLLFKVKNEQAGFTGFQDNDNVSFGHNSLLYWSLANANTALGWLSLWWNSAASGNVGIGYYSLFNGGINNVAIGVESMRNFYNSGNNNVAIGSQALHDNRQDQNTALGWQAAYCNKEGVGLTAMGTMALNSNTTENFNTAFGEFTLRMNTTGYGNVALGSGSLSANSTGFYNTAGGNCSLWGNAEGNENTAFGEQALSGNKDGNFNTAVGERALFSIKQATIVGDSAYSHGNANTAIGFEALREITTGSNNVGIGVHSMRFNLEGNENTAIGNNTIDGNTTGGKNVAVGEWSLSSNKTGNGNTMIGGGANVSDTAFNNATAIGNLALATESNQVVIGNNGVTSIGGYVDWTTISDGRVKRNIKQNVPGLEFINLLQPVTYHLDLDAADNILRTGKSQKNENDLLRASSRFIDTKARDRQQQRLHTGLIAQEVEKAAKSIGYNFSGVDAAKNENGLYGLRYSEFVVPLVKAVQELSAESKATDAAIASWQNQISELAGLVNQLLEKESKSKKNEVAGRLSAF